MSDFWLGKKHNDHRDAPGWLIVGLILLPGSLVFAFVMVFG